MSKTISIIELLNRIAKGEEVPEKIEYRNCMFYQTTGEGINPDYVNEDGNFFLEYISNEADSLNEIVELLEDEETIDIDEIEELDINNLNGIDGFTLARYEEIAFEKINEIIRYLKQINKLEER